MGSPWGGWAFRHLGLGLQPICPTDLHHWETLMRTKLAGKLALLSRGRGAGVLTCAQSGLAAASTSLAPAGGCSRLVEGWWVQIQWSPRSSASCWTGKNAQGPCLGDSESCTVLLQLSSGVGVSRTSVVRIWMRCCRWGHAAGLSSHGWHESVAWLA